MSEPDEVVYHVIQEGDCWVVRRRGASRASARVRTKAEALNYARSLKRRRARDVYVHRRDGRVVERRTFERHSASLRLSP